MADNGERLVKIEVTANYARRVAAGLYGVHSLLASLATGSGSTTKEIETRLLQVRRVARLFEDAANQPELDLPEATALGKL